MSVNSLNVLFTSLPGRYSKALFDEGKKASCLEKILDNFAKLEVFFKNQPSIKKLLTSGGLNVKDLDSGWRAVSDHLSFCPIFLSFIRQVVVNKRFNIIGRIRHIYNMAFAKYKNRRNVLISSAAELLPEQKKKIEKLINKIFKEKAIINYKINEKILAGVKIFSEEIVIDASALSRLRQLSQFYRHLKIRSTRK